MAVARTSPNLRYERSLQREGFALLAGMDEVGRGALAGPVSVGVVVIDPLCRSAPQGVRDSKLLAPPVREAIAPRIRRWAKEYAVGHASPAEIDVIGIVAALRLAGRRALSALAAPPDVIILDGNHDWLSQPDQAGLFETSFSTPPVRTVIKADRTCSTVASASVLAKVERDRLMMRLAGEHAAYGWECNKGYAAPEHLAALREYGPCELHRRSWRLPMEPVSPDEHLNEESNER